MEEIIRISFFSGIVCCCLAILKNVSFVLLPSYFLAGVVCGAIFRFFCVNLNFVLTGSFVATLVVCIMVQARLKCKNHDYLFIVLPTIYCITPGGALYDLFFSVYSLNLQQALYDFIYSIKVVIGCFFAIVFFEKIIRVLVKKYKDKKTIDINAA